MPAGVFPNRDSNTPRLEGPIKPGRNPASTQLMGVGIAGMGVVSLLLPGCCHGDANGAVITSWDSPPPHTHTQNAARVALLKAVLPLPLLSGNRQK